MRWWWQSPVPVEELLRELRAIAEVGFGEVEIAFSPGFWADEAQRAALAAVLEEAKRLGVGVATTLGAAWPLQTPNTTTGTKHAAQELQYGVNYIAGPADDAVPVPIPFDDLQGERPSRLLAVTAARVVRRGTPPTFATVNNWLHERRAIVPPTESTVLEAASVIDLTDRVADGALHWSIPEGQWAVFAFWTRDCVQGVTSFLDRDAAIAATEYLDEHQIGDENRDLLCLAGTELFEDSLELNADSLFWSPDLLERFRERRGYDPVPYLPVFFAHGMCRYWVPNEEPLPDFEFEDSSGARIRRDYYRLLTDLYIDNHLLVLQGWSAKYGLRHKSQVAYGQNLEPIRSTREFVRHGGRAEGESLNSGDRAPVRRDDPTWRFALDWQRALVGGAHQGGAVRISTELGAQFGAAYALTLGDLKQMLDKEWAAGITKPFVHGFASQEADTPWPTQSRFFDYVADSWNDLHYPEWKNWRGLTDYWARGTAVLETGLPRTDVAIYRDGFLTTAARGTPEADATAPVKLADTDAFERAGYSVQFLDPVGLAEPQALGAGGILFPEGPGYRAIVVDERKIHSEAAEALDAAARQGLRVVLVGEVPSADAGFAAGASGNERVRAAMGRLAERPTVAHVARMEEAAAALRGLGVVPRAAHEGPALLTQWREAESRRYVLVYNPDRLPVAVDLSLEGKGAVRYFNLWTGDVEQVPSSRTRDRTVVRVTLAPLGLQVFELDLDTVSIADEVAAPRANWVELPVSPWTVDVTTEESAGSRVFRIEESAPGDWRERKELAAVSGTARYRAQVVVGSERSFAIDLGELAGSAVVRAGGREFGPAYVSGTVLDLGDALAEDGTVEIEVRTALRNAVATSGARQMVGPELQAQGLLGPVRVLAR